MITDTATDQLSPPAYFEQIAGASTDLWRKLDSDPVLAGPWKQLFSQVKSPRHVLSELLQNADDAGATTSAVYIKNGWFHFEHNGRDFQPEELESLCRFGFSNKRSLHTIGFRGIGFKSTFSLGDTVYLRTPTLSVKFDESQFTLPKWFPASDRFNFTRVSVQLKDTNRQIELEKNLSEWSGSPISLLFFSSIRSLTIQDVTIKKNIIEVDQQLGFERILLEGSNCGELLHFRSELEPFPEEAIREIKQERNTDDLNLPPCRVELVLAKSVEPRVYVVLPTGVKPNLPFSCHGPFLQDPARFGIKEPSISPTNRWLLARAGELAAKSMLRWLGNAALPIERRVEAYDLLPTPPKSEDSLAGNATSAVSQAFDAATRDHAILLTDDGSLGRCQECPCLPIELDGVWPPTTLKRIFGHSDKRLLSSKVTKHARNQLEEWGWITQANIKDALTSIVNGTVPRPESFSGLANLWTLVDQYKIWLHRKNILSEAPLIPVSGCVDLHPSMAVVRMSSRRTGSITEGDWDYLSRLVTLVDPEWIEYLAQHHSEVLRTHEDLARSRAADILKQIGLESPTTIERILGNAWKAIANNPQRSTEDVIRITQILAATDSKIPDSFYFLSKHHSHIDLRQEPIFDPAGRLETLMPSELYEERVISDEYINSAFCPRSVFEHWARSEKSGLSTSRFSEPVVREFYTRDGLNDFLTQIGGQMPEKFHYRKNSFAVFESQLIPAIAEHLSKAANDTPTAWCDFLKTIMSGPRRQWEKISLATVSEYATNGSSRNLDCGQIPAAWIRQLANTPCLPDTYGRPFSPAELLLRTPDTEPMMGVEPFIDADLDTPQNREFLKLLGVRDTASGTEKLVDRIRAWSKTSEPPLHELGKWYEALDRAAARARGPELDAIRQTFSNERLIWSDDQQWCNSSEIFCFGGEESIPVATIHTSFSTLPIWKRLGVQDRPTRELVISWLQQLPLGHKLDTPALRRARMCLQAFPTDVWNTCNAWLSLDGIWAPTASLIYRVDSTSSVRVSELFSNAKSLTADLRFLRAEEARSSEFSDLTDLGSEIHLQLTEVQPIGSLSPLPKWLNTFCEYAARIKFTGEEEATQRLRSLANQLSKCRWQSVTKLQVTPYLHGAPVGQAHQPKVLWHDSCIYINDEAVVRLYEPLVAELSRPFNLPTITEVFRACIDRAESFVAEYIWHNFELEETVHTESEVVDYPTECCSATLLQCTNSALVFPGDATVDPESDGSDSSAGSSEQQSKNLETLQSQLSNGSTDDPQDSIHDNPSGEANEEVKSIASGSQDNDALETADPPMGTGDGQRAERSKEKPIIERFAEANQFHWLPRMQLYTHADGSTLRRTSGLFNWEIYQANGNLRWRLWFTSQYLEAGVEIPAELWDVIRQSPKGTAIILNSHNGPPLQLPGTRIEELINLEVVKLFPAKYRLKQFKELSNQGAVQPVQVATQREEG